MKVSLLVVTALILSIALLGFGTGWVLSQSPSGKPPSGVTGTEDDPSEEPREEDLSLPSEDVDGEEILGLPRYPGSIRVKHEQQQIGDLLVTTAGYLVDADLNEAREFYRDTFREEEWAVADVSYARGEWTFFIAKEDREVTLEIEEQDSLVKVEMELSEPGEPKPSAGPATQQPPAPQPEPVPQPAPAPAREDDEGDYYGEDYEDYGEDYEDGFEDGDD